MGKKETDEERRKRLAMESIARMKSALGGVKVPGGGKAASLDGIDKKGIGSDAEADERAKKAGGFGSSSKMKRTPSDDTVDGIMGMFGKKKRK